MIQEAIRKIALGRSIERIEMAPGGMGGVGTARMIHGYVAKIHDDPSDEEFADYGGTVDVANILTKLLRRAVSSTKACCWLPPGTTRAVFSSYRPFFRR